MNIENIINTIVSNNKWHAKWLNTLSMMENSGARKISASEHPTKVNLIILKHAAEEARHAYYLKKQLTKLDYNGCEDYTYKNLLAATESYQYLHRLDTQISRYIQENLKLKGYDLRYAAYLLVTYAIEVRADSLYEIYQSVLKKHNSRVTVKSIILEEIGHLEEMTKQLKDFSADWEIHAEYAIRLEQELFEIWMNKVKTETAA
jgi:bacterioferritin (cytochrome b1)